MTSQQTRERTSFSLTHTVPHVHETLEEDFATLVELEEQLPEVGSQIRDIRKVYDRGRDKVRCRFGLAGQALMPIFLASGATAYGIARMAEHACLTKAPHDHLHAERSCKQEVESPRCECIPFLQGRSARSLDYMRSAPSSLLSSSRACGYPG